MSAFTVPLRNDLPHYEFQVELDNATYGLELRWNFLSEAWFMSIYTSDDILVVADIRIVVDWPLGGRYADARMPPGRLIALDTTGEHQDPGLADLGTRTQLLYFTRDEFA